MLRSILHVASRAADWCGLQFKPRTCASLHLDFRKGQQKVQSTTFCIMGGDMRALKEGDHYIYLGSPVGFKSCTSPNTALESLMADPACLKASDLPRQKLDALMTFLPTRMSFPLRVAPVTRKDLNQADRAIREAVRSWLFLPVRASTEILHLPSHAGGGGYMPLPHKVVEASILAIVQVYRMLTCKATTIQDSAWYGLRDSVHKRMGRSGPPLDRRVMCLYLSGLMEGDLGTNAGEMASTWRRARKASRCLASLCAPGWEWSEMRREISLRVRNSTPSTKLSIIPSSARHRLTTVLRRAVSECYRRRLVAKPDQARMMEVVTASTEGSHFILSGEHTRLVDWAFVHRGRLCTPLTWCTEGKRKTRIHPLQALQGDG
ncbi:uncharacterized protein [Hetaerina americana]|uniref:uncharacterized protein n=1 Tax=Hetaerina americana TaxID=62018 RepID=UPI003A7F26AE